MSKAVSRWGSRETHHERGRPFRSLCAQVKLSDLVAVSPSLTFLALKKVIMKSQTNKIKMRNPYATALQKRHGGGVKAHKDKSKYTRKVKHKGKAVK